MVYHFFMIIPFCILFHSSKKKYSSVCLTGIILSIATILSFDIIDVIYGIILMICSLLLLPSIELYRDSYKNTRFKNILPTLIFIVLAYAAFANLYEIEAKRYVDIGEEAVVDNFKLAYNSVINACNDYQKKTKSLPTDDTGRIIFSLLDINEPGLFKGQGTWKYSYSTKGKVSFVLSEDSYLYKQGYAEIFNKINY